MTPFWRHNYQHFQIVLLRSFWYSKNGGYGVGTAFG